MPMPQITNIRGLRQLAIVVVVGFSALALVSCGSSDGSSGGNAFQKIDPGTQILSIDDFVAAGFKKSKQYDVAGLPGAVDARMGFWGPNASNRTDYELRFYASHEAAVNDGAPLADEATGELFREKKDSQTWTEGQKDRWRNGNVTAGSTGGVTAGPGPIYGDFAIYSNVVLLCEGADSAQALERCKALLDSLRKASG